MERKKKYYAIITRNLLIAFFCLSVVPIVGFAWMMKTSVEETNVNKLGELALSTVAHRGEVIEMFLNEKISFLNAVVAMHSEDYLLDQRNIEQLYLAMSPKGDTVDLQTIDASGHQHAYVGPYRSKVEGKSYADAGWFKETLINGVHVSDVFDGYRGVPHFVVAVTNPLKTFVLRATINSSFFNSLLHSAQLSPRGDVFIVNRSGEFQTPSLQGLVQLNAAERRLISYDSDGLQVMDTDIYSTHWIDKGHWLLILKANIADSLGYYLQVRNQIILIVIIISVAAMSGATVISISLSKKLEQSDREHAALHLQFAQVEKMATVGRLAAGIAHEINNPLQMITNQAGWISELLPDEDPDRLKNYEEYAKAVEQIKYHVRRAGTITHRLLGFSRKMSAQNEKVQVNDLLTETISFVEKEAGYNNITITRKLDANLPETLTDAPQLQQVFLNLINNAIDAVGRDGEVTVCTRFLKDGQVEVDITDTGPGIQPDHLKQLFDPFFTTKAPGKGTGLGLYISYDIVHKLGGTIRAENRKGGGAVFTIVLPVMSMGMTV